MRPSIETLKKQSAPKSLQRIIETTSTVDPFWIGPDQAVKLSKDEQESYDIAHAIMCHLVVQAPTKHGSGHPGGPLSAFTLCYFLSKMRHPHIDQPLRMSAGHLSLLAYGLQWFFGREGSDARLASPQSVIDTFRTPSGLPGHAEAGIGDIPFGAGPLGKGVSNGLGVALGLKYLEKIKKNSSPSPAFPLPPAVASGLWPAQQGGGNPIVDVLLADGDSQEGQVQEAFRLAAHLKLDNLIVHGDFNDIQLSGRPTETVAADFASIALATGWNVIEVQDGNDPGQVKAALEKANELSNPPHLNPPPHGRVPRPIFICYYTTMGHGISFMEQASNDGSKNFHGTPLSQEEAKEALKDLSPLDDLIRQYQPHRKKEKDRYESNKPTLTNIPIDWSIPKKYKRAITDRKGAARKDFGATHIKNLMEYDQRIIVLHADLAGSGGFDVVEKSFPSRVFNVGVAEANMAMMAAGLRQVGLLPITYTFAAFGTNEARANARLIDMNCGHTRCAVLHDCTHAGVSVGEDGETHQEQNYMNIPFYNTRVWCPADSNQAGAMAERGIALIADGKESVYVFSGRSGHEQLKNQDETLMYDQEYEFEGRADIIRGKGTVEDRATIIATGMTLHTAMAAYDEYKKENETDFIRILNVAQIHPIDAGAIIQAALETGHLIVVEDHNIEGGLSTKVADIIADFALPCSLRRLGLRQYYPSGKSEDLMILAGIDIESIINALHDELAVEISSGEEAFVACVHEMAQNIQYSRFRGSTMSFVNKLLHEEGYMEALRDHYRKKGCQRESLPNTDDLKKRFPSV